MAANFSLSPLTTSGAVLPDHASAPNDIEAAHGRYLTPVIAYCDGCCEPTNPGGHACGGVDIGPRPDVLGLERGLRFGRCYVRGVGVTNNTAEYNACLDALRTLFCIGWRGPVVLHTDSQFVVRQYKGEYSCHTSQLQELLARLRRASDHLESVTLEWIPRALNQVTDGLSRRAYHEARRREGTVAP